MLSSDFITEIDRLEVSHRNLDLDLDLNNLLIGLDNLNSLSISDASLDFEILSDKNEYGNCDEKIIEQNDDDVDFTESMNADVGAKNRNLYTDRDYQPRRESIHETVKELLNSLHSKNSEIHALKYQLKHKELQTEAFVNRERNLKITLDKQLFQLAQKEQDIALLEAKLVDISNYEGKCSISSESQIDLIRGKMLSVANNKIFELNNLLSKYRLEFSELKISTSEIAHENESKIKSLKLELENVCNQLANRTVLYSAHERRWNHAMRLNEGVNSEIRDELVQLRFSLSQAENRCETAEQERLELTAKNREINEKNSRLELEIVQATDKFNSLETEFSNIKTLNESLQAVISRLKNTDMDAIEREMSQNVGTIRKEFRIKEDILKRNVDELKSRLSHELLKQEALMKEIEILRTEVDERDGLLEQMGTNFNISGIANKLTADSTNTSQAHNRQHYDILTDNSEDKFDSLNDNYKGDFIDGNIKPYVAAASLISGYEIVNRPQIKSYRESVSFLFPADDEQVQQDPLKQYDLKQDQKNIDEMPPLRKGFEYFSHCILITEKLLRFAFESDDAATDASTSITQNSNLISLGIPYEELKSLLVHESTKLMSIFNLISLHLGKLTSSEHVRSSSLSDEFLLADNITVFKVHSLSDISSNLVEQNDALLTELKEAYITISSLRNQETTLTENIKKLSLKLALVLRKAAEFQVNEGEKVTMSSCNVDPATMLEQLEAYQLEVKYFEQLALQSRDAGAATEAIKYEEIIKQLDGKIMAMELNMQNDTILHKETVENMEHKLAQLLREISSQKSLLEVANFEREEMLSRMVGSSYSNQVMRLNKNNLNRRLRTNEVQLSTSPSSIILDPSDGPPISDYSHLTQYDLGDLCDVTECDLKENKTIPVDLECFGGSQIVNSSLNFTEVTNIMQKLQNCTNQAEETEALCHQSPSEVIRSYKADEKCLHEEAACPALLVDTITSELPENTNAKIILTKNLEESSRQQSSVVDSVNEQYEAENIFELNDDVLFQSGILNKSATKQLNPMIMEEVPLHRIYTVNKELELRWNSMKEYLETRYKEKKRKLKLKFHDMIAKGYADSEAQQQHIFTDLRELREERHPETIEQSTQCSQNDTTGISLDFDTGTNKINGLRNDPVHIAFLLQEVIREATCVKQSSKVQRVVLEILKT